jgi:hypothetical protein
MAFLQIATAEATSVAAHPDPGVLSSMPFSLDFLLHAAAIWIALIAICVIVFAYRRRGKPEKRGFQDTYHEELEAMRKGRSDRSDEAL